MRGASRGSGRALSPWAKAMRREPTVAESRLWAMLRRGRLGVRFRRQVVVDRFIVDFLCERHRLVVEVDGEAHEGRADLDAERDARLLAMGLRVIRLRNEEVLERRTR